MSQWILARTVIEEDGVAATIDQRCVNYPRLEEMWEGITWRLAREGDRLGAAKIIGGVQYHLCVFENVIEELPEVTVLYTIEPNVITIWGVEIEIGKEVPSIGKVHTNS